MDFKLFKNMGFTESEIRVYFALLELGSSTKGPVVNKSGVASSKIYELLEKLIEKGLVSYVIRSNIKYFEAAPTERILDYVKEKKSMLEIQERKLKKILPELDLMRSRRGIGSETQVFRGIKGAKTCFDDILKELRKGDKYYVLGISKFSPAFKRFVVSFHKKRARLGIKCKIVVNELVRSIGKELESIPLTQVRYIKKELFTPVVFIIYKEKIIISVELDEIFIQIKSKNLSLGLKTYARYMFSLGKK